MMNEILEKIRTVKNKDGRMDLSSKLAQDIIKRHESWTRDFIARSKDRKFYETSGWERD